MVPRLSRYEVLGKIASGGMANVWLARSTGPGGFEKRVVLKTILPEQAKVPEFRAMFEHEARVAANLNHPNCVQIFELGHENGIDFIAMEYIEGFSFARVLKRAQETRRPISLTLAVRILCDVATGLDYAHALKSAQGEPLNIVHRDISFDNILISFSGQVKVVDFGIARANDAKGERTRTGLMKGKVGYMAPEYLRGDPVDGRADLFSLGVVAYRALTGRRPFDGTTEVMVCKAILDSEPKPLRELNPQVPEAVAEVIHRALVKHPSQRFESGKALRKALAAALPSVATTEQLAEQMDLLWPAGDPERGKLEALATGEHTSSPALEPIISEEVDLEALDAEARQRDGLSPDRATAVVERPLRRWVLPAAVGVLALAVIVAGAAFWSGQREGGPAEGPAGDAAGAGQPEAGAQAPSPTGAGSVAVSAPGEPERAGTEAGAAGAGSAVAARDGTLVIRAQPAVTVWREGVELGRTPGPFKLPLGTHRLRLAERSLGIDRTVQAEVKGGDVSTLDVTFGRAQLELRVSPWADVRIDGRRVGSTPLPVQSLFEGRHHVELRNDELNKTRRLIIELRPGEHRTVREVLD